MESGLNLQRKNKKITAFMLPKENSETRRLGDKHNKQNVPSLVRFQFCEISEYIHTEFICADTYTCTESIQLNSQDNAETSPLSTAATTVSGERLHTT